MFPAASVRRTGRRRGPAAGAGGRGTGRGSQGRRGRGRGRTWPSPARGDTSTLAGTHFKSWHGTYGTNPDQIASQFIILLD